MAEMIEKITNSDNEKIVTQKSPVKQSKKMWLPAILIIIAVTVFLLIPKSPTKSTKTPERFMVFNTSKSVYSSGENVLLYASVTDASGKNTCVGNLKIEITAPDKTTNELSTENDRIATSATCTETGQETHDPDYQSGFLLTTEGKYKLVLTDLDTKKTIEKNIEVKNGPDFMLERRATTRINPSEKERFHMILTLASKNDFKGQLVDILPPTVKIAWKGPAKIDSEKIIWEVEIKAGEQKEFIYDYTLTPTAPQIISFGPANIATENKEVFREINSWQIIEGTPLKQDL